MCGEGWCVVKDGGVWWCVVMLGCCVVEDGVW